MSTKKPKPIKEGDRVRVVVPKVVLRVGYPKQVSDYLDAAKARYGAMLTEDMPNPHCVEKALFQIAYGLAKADGFGGRERSLHMQDAPEILGQEFTVTGARMVQTGTYYPPHYYQNTWGEWDGEPGGLENMKARRLLRGVWARWAIADSVFTSHTDAEILAEHVERV